jgi:hypothetical protein
MPFNKAVELLADFCGVVISRETARRLCEGAGKLYEEYQTEEVERLERELPENGGGLPHAQVSVDGAMVGLVGGEWAEVKTLAIGSITQKPNEKGEQESHCEQLSYFSRLMEAEQFGRAALVETWRRGLSESSKVSAVMDGAEWLQGFIDFHCPKATRILDFPHAAQRIAGIGEAILGAGSAEAKTWLAEKSAQLKHKGAEGLLAELEQLQVAHPTNSVVLENLNYLKKRQSQIEYAQFRAEGHPIGSGIVESANKLVVQARLKGAGMHWQRVNVNAMLALRNLECNGRWQEGWRQIEQLNQKVRFAKRQARRTSPLSDPVLTEAASPMPPLSPPCPKAPSPKPPYSGKPAPDHPWRKAKFGKAIFELSKAG